MTALADVSTRNAPGQPRSRYRIDCGAAQIHVHARSLATVLSVVGEVDAANAGLVTAAIRRFSRLNAPLILDLGHLEFLGSSGFRELLVLDGDHRRDGLHYSVVDGAALHRVATMMPDHGLPIVDSVPEALWGVADLMRARRRFGAGLARQQEPQRSWPREGCQR